MRPHSEMIGVVAQGGGILGRANIDRLEGLFLDAEFERRESVPTLDSGRWWCIQPNGKIPSIVHYTAPFATGKPIDSSPSIMISGGDCRL